MLLLSGTVPQNLLLLVSDAQAAHTTSGLRSAALGKVTEFLQQEPGMQNTTAEYTKTWRLQQLKARHVYYKCKCLSQSQVT